MRSKEPAYRAKYWQLWSAANRPRKIFLCSTCSTAFAPRGSQRRCAECIRPPCANCGRRFKPGRHAQRFCSKECGNASRRGGEPPQLAANRGRKPRTYYERNRSKHGSAQDREWRAAVFARDRFTCQQCGVVGGRFNADHIVPYSQAPELRFELSNGRTLCVQCHRQTATFGWRGYWLKRR